MTTTLPPAATPPYRHQPRPSRGYHFKAGSYIYVNCPAIDRAEWHPFSLIPVPGATLRAAFYAEAVRTSQGPGTDLFFRSVCTPANGHHHGSRSVCLYIALLRKLI